MNELRAASLQAKYDTVIQALVDCNFNKKKAAEKLGIDRKTLYNILKGISELKKTMETAA